MTDPPRPTGEVARDQLVPRIRTGGQWRPLPRSVAVRVERPYDRWPMIWWLAMWILTIALIVAFPESWILWVVVLAFVVSCTRRLLDRLRRQSRTDVARIQPTTWHALAEKARLTEQARADRVRAVDPTVWWMPVDPLPLIDAEREPVERPVLIIVNLNTLIDAARVETVGEFADVGPGRSLSRSMADRLVTRAAIWTAIAILIAVLYGLSWFTLFLAAIPGLFALRPIVQLTSALGWLPFHTRSAIAAIGAVELGWLWRTTRFTVDDSVLVLSTNAGRRPTPPCAPPSSARTGAPVTSSSPSGGTSPPSPTCSHAGATSGPTQPPDTMHR